MEITEVRIKLIEDGGERLHAFCSITLDDSFVVRDLKIIEGTNGPFVAMPSRKLTSHCPQCGMKNHLRSAYCNQCGSRQKDERPARDEEGRTKLYADIAHPINSACREMIQQRVISEYHHELKRSKLPGYVSRYDDIDGDYSPPSAHKVIADGAAGPVPAPHLAAPHAPAAHAGPVHAAPSHAPSAHAPKAHAPKAPSAAASGGLDQPRIQSAEDPRNGSHRPPASANRSTASTKGPDGFGAGVFDS
ncbi:MAG TPA: SpoVG family protein [Pirellulales bacterium]|nr:SpoVG family protein [Pirellulales bacterium]